MAEQFRRKALMDIFGEEPETDPLAPAPPPPIPPPVAKPNLGADPLSFTQGMDQRGGGTGGALGGAASGASAGAAAGSILPGLGTGIGAAIGGIGGALKGIFDKKASTAPTDYSVPDATKAITDAYTTYNGRPPAAGEVDQILAGQGLKPGDRYVGSGGLNSVLSQLQTNAKTAPAAPAGGTAAPGAGFADPGTPTGATLASAGALDLSRLEGYAPEKLTDPNHKSYNRAKSAMGRAFTGFDPRAGITPEVLAALNALGYGTFSGKGDKLSLSGLTDAGRAAGLVGDYRDADFIKGLKGGDGKWVYADPAYEAMHPEESASGAAGGGSLGGNPFGGEALDDALNGDPLAAIRAAIAKFSGSRPNAAALMNQLGGG
jgi:hypothetical protein